MTEEDEIIADMGLRNPGAAKRLKRFSRTADAYWRKTQPSAWYRLRHRLWRIQHRVEMRLDTLVYDAWDRLTQYCLRRGLLDKLDGLMRQTREGEHQMSHCKHCGHHQAFHTPEMHCHAEGCTCAAWKPIRSYKYR